VTAAAEELTTLMKGDEECQRYARTCKALDGLIAQLTAAELSAPATTIAVLRALHAACLNDKNQQVSPVGRMPSRLVLLFGGAELLHVESQMNRRDAGG
jgi:hypothetical protein